MEIIDAHQHFWDPVANYHPWLRDEPPIAFRYGDYRAIRRRYLPPDYLTDARNYTITGTVYVETEWDPHDPIGETRYVATLRREFGLPTVSVAQGWLDRADWPAVLEAQAAFPFVRSVRHKPRANPAASDSPPGGMTDPAWRAGFALLSHYGLRFDLQTPWWHLDEAAELARDFDDTQIILNHAGLPSDRSAEGLAGWRSAMARLAELPNVAVKISGIGQPNAPWSVEANSGIVRTAIELFGTDRCMFASNFPVDGLCASFDTIFSGFREIVRDFSASEQQALFRDNARRIYAMD